MEFHIDLENYNNYNSCQLLLSLWNLLLRNTVRFIVSDTIYIGK